MKTRTFVVSVILAGDPVAIESSIEMLIESIDFVGLDSVEVVVRNESEDVKDE